MTVGSAAIRRDLLLIVLGTALLYGVALGARDLWNPNEPIYGRAVVELAERDAWLIPTVNGEVFAEKPILWFWLARAAALVLGGVDELSLRLPSALCGSAGAVLVYLLVLPYAGSVRSRIAAALLATCYVVFWNARSVQMDLLLAVCVLGALLAASRVLDFRARPVVGGALVGFAAGLGFLAKGPAGVLLPLLVVAAYLAVERRVPRSFGRAILASGATLLAVVIPWLLTLFLSGEAEFLREAILRQNLGRFTDPWDHRQPWWYYLVYLWTDMAPWSLFLPVAAGLPWWRTGERRLDRLGWCWLLVPLLLFSLSPSKRSAYLLPVAPAVAILISGVAQRILSGDLGRARRRAVAALLVGLGLLLAGAGAMAWTEVPGRYPDISREAIAVSALLLASAPVCLLAAWWLTRRPVFALLTVLAVPLALYGTTATLLLPTLNARESARGFSERIVEQVGDRPLRSYRPWKWRAGYVYYTGRRIPRLTSPDELRSYWNTPRPVFVIVERLKREEFLSVTGAGEPLVTRGEGDRLVELYWNSMSGPDSGHRAQ